MRFLYNNLLDSATLTSDGAIPGFGLANLKDTRLSRTYRSIGTADNIVIDLGAAYSVDTVALAGHNLTVDATVEANSVNDFSAPPFSETLDHADDTMYQTFTAATYRYWRICINDPSVSNGQIEIGRVGIGAGLQGPGVGLNLQLPVRSTSEKSYSRTRQSYTNEGVRYRACSFQFNYFDSTDKAAFDAMFEYSDVNPIFVDFDELTTERAYYANISGEFDFSYVGSGRFYTLNLEFEEVG